MANLLNLLGLSLAFASFFVIMTQVNFDLSYNKSFNEYENLFRMTMKLGHGGLWNDAASSVSRATGSRFASRHRLCRDAGMDKL